jgi:hypothetical protein
MGRGLKWLLMTLGLGVLALALYLWASPYLFSYLFPYLFPLPLPPTSSSAPCRQPSSRGTR